MRRKLLGVLVTAILMCLFTGTAMAAPLQVQPTNSVVYVNGVQIKFEAYTINGSIYFKLRDIAMALKDTNKEFSVGYDSGSDTVIIDTKGTYAPVGGELSAGNGQTKTAEIRQGAFQFNGDTNQDNYRIALSSYNIGGSSFVKLRDLMQWLDAGVGYDAQTAAVTVTTHQKYELPKSSGNPLAGAAAMESKVRGKYGNVPGNIMSKAYSVQAGDYYFRLDSGGTMYRYSSDGKQQKKFTTDPRWVDGNLQAYNGKLYYEATLASSGTSRSIFSMNMDGTGRKAIVSGTVDDATPHNYIIYNGKMYARTLTTSGKQNIVSLNLDGSGRKILYDGDLVAGGSMGQEYDGINNFYINNDRIYFLKLSTPKNYSQVNLMSINLNGGDLRTHSAFSGYPALMEVDDNFAFYRIGATIYRTNLNGSNRICVYKGDNPRYAMVFYGDKILYETQDATLGVMNNDGTGKCIMANAPMKDLARTGIINVHNAQYTYVEYILTESSSKDGRAYDYGKALVRNDAKTPGYINVEKYVPNEGTYPVWTVSNAAFPDKEWQPQSYKYVNPQDGVYTIKPYNETSKAWAIGANSVKDGEKTILWDVSGKDNQKFQITTSKNQSTIKAVHSGKNLFAPNEKGVAVQQSGSSPGKFYFVDAGNNAVNIMTEDGYYLGAAAGKYDNNTQIITWTRSNNESQKFRLSKTDVVEKEAPKVDSAKIESGVYFITSKKEPGKVLDVSGESKKDGANVLLWDLTAGENQKFIFTIDGNKCTIRAKHSDMALIAPSEKGGELTQSGTLPPTTFYLVDAGDGVVNIMTEDGLYVGVSGGKMTNGSKLITWTKSTEGSQDFVLKQPFGE